MGKFEGSSRIVDIQEVQNVGRAGRYSKVRITRENHEPATYTRDSRQQYAAILVEHENRVERLIDRDPNILVFYFNYHYFHFQEVVGKSFLTFLLKTTTHITHRETIISQRKYMHNRCRVFTALCSYEKLMFQ